MSDHSPDEGGRGSGGAHDGDRSHPEAEAGSDVALDLRMQSRANEW
jgi:hypothetical protein